MSASRLAVVDDGIGEVGLSQGLPGLFELALLFLQEFLLPGVGCGGHLLEGDVQFFPLGADGNAEKLPAAPTAEDVDPTDVILVPPAEDALADVASGQVGVDVAATFDLNALDLHGAPAAVSGDRGEQDV